MVRSYKPKLINGVPVRKVRSKENIISAVKEIHEKNTSIRKAAKIYNIPRTTLRTHYLNTDTEKPGHPTILSKDEEEMLVTGIVAAGDFGFGREKADIIEMVAHFIAHSGRRNPFKEGIPGDDWFRSFCERWKTQLSARKPEIPTISRATACNETVVRSYFTILEDTIDRLDLRYLPNHIINLDESGFVTDPKAETIFVRKGKKDPVTIIPGSVVCLRLVWCTLHLFCTKDKIFINHGAKEDHRVRDMELPILDGWRR